MKNSERLYSFMLRLYPHNYREEYGEEMLYVFAESRKDLDSTVKINFWTKIILDLVKSLLMQHLENLKGKNFMNIIRKNKRFAGMVLAIGILLLVPLVAMQFTGEVKWTLFDFIVMGALLGSVALMFEIALRLTRNVKYRAGVGLALVAVFLLVWINGAVGIIGSEDNPVNMMYFGVVLLGIGGALLSGFKPNGMSKALFATAVAQALVPIIAIALNRPYFGSFEAIMGIFRVLMLNTVFVMMFAASGMLFKQAAYNRDK